MIELSLIQKIIVWAIPVLFAITVHEVAHGWVALKFGDRTAQMLGRLTLNPLKHIDIVGTIIVPLFLLTLSGFVFGWAKPVPVNDRNLRQPKTDMAWVVVAGPAANMVMAMIWAFVAKIGLLLLDSGVALGQPMVLMGTAGILINAMLMMLNLLPIPPLDGSKVLISVLPGPMGWRLSQIEPYGFFILLGLLYFGILWQILGPMVTIFMSLLTSIFGLPPGIYGLL